MEGEEIPWVQKVNYLEVTIGEDSRKNTRNNVKTLPSTTLENDTGCPSSHRERGRMKISIGLPHQRS